MKSSFFCFFLRFLIIVSSLNLVPSSQICAALEQEKKAAELETDTPTKIKLLRELLKTASKNPSLEQEDRLDLLSFIQTELLYMESKVAGPDKIDVDALLSGVRVIKEEVEEKAEHPFMHKLKKYKWHITTGIGSLIAALLIIKNRKALPAAQGSSTPPPSSNSTAGTATPPPSNNSTTNTVTPPPNKPAGYASRGMERPSNTPEEDAVLFARVKGGVADNQPTLEMCAEFESQLKEKPANSALKNPLPKLSDAQKKAARQEELRKLDVRGFDPKKTSGKTAAQLKEDEDLAKALEESAAMALKPSDLLTELIVILSKNYDKINSNDIAQISAKVELLKKCKTLPFALVSKVSEKLRTLKSEASNLTQPCIANLMHLITVLQKATNDSINAMTDSSLKPSLSIDMPIDIKKKEDEQKKENSKLLERLQSDMTAALKVFTAAKKENADTNEKELKDVTELLNKMNVEETVTKIVAKYSTNIDADNQIITVDSTPAIVERFSAMKDWDYNFEGTTLHVHQIPVLRQSDFFGNPTDYCAVYAYYNGWMLNKAGTHAPKEMLPALQKAGIDKRSEFIKSFKDALSLIGKERQKNPKSVINAVPQNLESIALLDNSELILMETTFKRGIQNLITSAESTYATGISDIIRNFVTAPGHVLRKNIPLEAFVVNTKKNGGSHWLTIGLEKIEGEIHLFILDSLGLYRKDDLGNWLGVKKVVPQPAKPDVSIGITAEEDDGDEEAANEAGGSDWNAEDVATFD